MLTLAMTLYFSLCTLCCMRSFLTILFFSYFLALIPSISNAAVQDSAEHSKQQMEGLLQSEFAFQAGQYTRALSFYKDRPMALLSLNERVRSSQLAMVSGDMAWLQSVLATPAGAATAEPKEILSLRFMQGIRANNESMALSAWQALIALPKAEGVELSREIIDKHSVHFQAVLERTLQNYAQLPKLTNAELYELYLYAFQWQKLALAEQLSTRLPASSNEAIIAQLTRVCFPERLAACQASMDALDPLNFDELERRSILGIAQQSGLDAQTYRWLLQQTQDGNSYYQRIVLLGKQWDEKKATKLVVEIEADSALNPFQRAVLLGSVAELQKEWPSAEKYYREALALNTPTTASVRLAVVLFRQKKTAEALLLLEKIQRDETLSDEIRRDAFFTEVQFQQLSGVNNTLPQQDQNAVYQRALLIWPQAQRIRYQYAMRLFNQGQVSAALQQLQQIIKAAPTDVDALNAYGYTLAKELNQPRSGLKSIEQAFLIAPNRAEVLDSYGYVLYRLGRNTEALPTLQKAWKLTPSAVTAGHLANVFLQMGDKQQAQDFLKKGLELDSTEADLIKLKEFLP
jgi:thioredoxin-like negative regulator of GroEL